MTRNENRKKKVIFPLIILACSYFVLFNNLGAYSLKEPDEGRYAEIPREMVEQGDYLVPHLNYVRYFEKPPLLYWAVALSYKAFGVSEWSFRLPNALAALFLILMTLQFVSRRMGDEAGFLSALILLTSFGFFGIARIVTIDMLFSFLLFAALLSFQRFYEEQKRLHMNLFALASSLALLAKGPVALILLSLTILLFLWSEKRLSFLRAMLRIDAILLFAAIAVPWFTAISLKEKEFFSFFFLDQHLLRFLTTRHKRSGPLYYFIPVLLGGLFPWSLFIPRAVADLWRDREVRLFLIWSGVVFLFFSFSGSKLPPYILPVFPALAVVLARFFLKVRETPLRLGPERIVCVAFFALTGLIGLAHATGFLEAPLARVPEIAAVARSIRGLSIIAAFSSFAALAAMAAILLRRPRTPKPLLMTLAAFSLVLFTGITLHPRAIDRPNTTKALARLIEKSGEASPLVINYGSFDETLPFYLKRRTVIAGYQGELAMGAKYPDAAPYFTGDEEVGKLFRAPGTLFLIVKEKRLPRLPPSIRDRATVIACTSGRCLLTNNPGLARLGSQGQ